MYTKHRIEICNGIKRNGNAIKHALFNLHGLLNTPTYTPTILIFIIVGEPEIQKLEKSGRKVAEF